MKEDRMWAELCFTPKTQVVFPRSNRQEYLDFVHENHTLKISEIFGHMCILRVLQIQNCVW